MRDQASSIATHSECTASARNCRMAGPLRSWYTPPLALSLMVTTPNVVGSPIELGLPPCWCGITSEVNMLAEIPSAPLPLFWAWSC